MSSYSKPVIKYCLLFVVSAFCFSCQHRLSQEQTAVIFAKNKVTELTDSNYSFLKKIGNQSQIIGVGEATHGSKEFNEVRLAFFKYLVQNCNYKLFCFEGDFSTFLPVSNYVESGIGEPEDLLLNTSWFLWDGQDMLKIVEWMRAYNKDKSSEQKVRLIGIDMRNLEVILLDIKKYFKANKTSNQDEILLEIANLFKLDEKSAQYLKELQRLSDLVKADTQADHNYSLESGNYLIHYLQLNLEEEIAYKKASTLNQKMDLRDRFMAQNTEWFCKHSNMGGKALLAAHNLHVAKMRQGVYKICGEHLKEDLGIRYFNIYIDFASGSALAHGGKHNNIGVYNLPGNKDAFSYHLQSAQRNSFFLNLRDADHKTRAVLNQLFVFNQLGSTFESDAQASAKFNLAQQFDGYVYLPAVTAKQKIRFKL